MIFLTANFQRPSKYAIWILLYLTNLIRQNGLVSLSGFGSSTIIQKTTCPSHKTCEQIWAPLQEDQGHEPSHSKKNTGKSGITPLSPFFPQNMANRTLRSRQQKYQFYFYQQHRYRGFTAAEIHGMDALSALNTIKTSSPMINVIHPMFGKGKWDKENELPRQWPLIPLFYGHDGFWQVCFSDIVRDTVANYSGISRSAIRPYGASSSPHLDLPHVFYPTLQYGRGRF